ncbi:class II D-tagatose-bisphosphate aldolase, non-catalytic subunit, partial [Streptomyces sp. SID11233]|nr:class II D-tagatose-bisphosphate aldolase, non-catalytic subunit [Streptomyces sp. SID11233]
ARVRAGVLAARPHDLVIDRVRDVLRTYATACAPRPKEYA